MSRVKSTMSKPAYIAILIAAVAVGSLLGGWVFQLMWNWLMPELFGLPVLSFWQAWGLWVLIGSIANLFKSSK